MGEFRRTHSKVWWANGMDEPSIGAAGVPPSANAPDSPWGPGVDLSNRGLSVSPSSGSHRSQDSGFSDSEERKESSSETSAKRSPELTTRNNLGTKNINGTTNKVSNLERETKQKISNLEISATTKNTNDKSKVSNLDRCFPTCLAESTSKTQSASCYNFADVRKMFESRAVAGPQTASKQFNISAPLNKPLVQNQKRFFEEKSKPETDYNQTSPPSLGQYYENKEQDAARRLSDVGPETNVDGSTIEKNYISDDENAILTVCRSRANSCSGSDASEELRRLSEANDGHDDEEDEIAEKDSLSSWHTLQKRQSSSSSGCSIVGCIPKISSSSNISEQRTELELVADQFPVVFMDLSEPFDPPAHQSTPKGQHQSAPQRVGRPVKLIHDFERISEDVKSQEDKKSFLAAGRDSVKTTACPAVNRWLNELGTLYEPECTITLQSKALAVTDLAPNADLTRVTRDQVLALQAETRIIGEQFDQLCRQLDEGVVQHVGPLVQSLVGRVNEFCRLHRPPPATDALARVTRRCDALRRAAITANSSRPSSSPDRLARMLADLGRAFAVVVDLLLAENIQGMVYTLEQPKNEMCMRSALTALSSLSLQGPVLARGIGRAGGVRALLGVCLDTRHATLRATALRALAGVCCVASNIRYLEQCNGVELISEILCDTQRGEIERAEAAAVLAQITAPWVEENPGVAGLSVRVPSVITALTDLSRATRSDETLLLCTAALANLTSLESSTAVWSLLEHRTAATVLSAVRRRGTSASVFLQEQAATLVANMAAVPETRPKLADERAVAALLCFLQPSVNISATAFSTRSAEAAAAVRVQQKAAIALSRLCSEPTVAEQVVALEGVKRLVRLCREDRERHHSDGVLVACLATLRKIAANCGTSAMEELGAMSLVEPRLLDSYLIYSSRQESYV